MFAGFFVFRQKDVGALVPECTIFYCKLACPKDAQAARGTSSPTMLIFRFPSRLEGFHSQARSTFRPSTFKPFRFPLSTFRFSSILSPMHIWLLSPFSPLPTPGAHESRSAALARHLTQAGHQVVWFTMDWDHRRKETVGEVVPDFANNSELGTSSPTTPHFPSSLPHAPCHLLFPIPVPPYTKNISLRRFYSHRVWGNRLIKTAKQKIKNAELAPPDLILASSPPLDAPRAAFRLQKHFGCQVKIDLTDLWPHSFQSAFSKFPVPAPHLLSPIFHLLLRQAHAHWRQADGISAMSQEYLDEVLHIAPGQKTHLCYIGGKVEKWEGGKVENGKRKAEINSPVTTDTAFLYLGALTDSYDFDTLFAAAEILIAEGHDFHIHIAGSGPLEQNLELTTNNRQLTTHFTFHGFLNQEEMHKLCAHCDIGLNIIRQGLHITMPHKLNDYLCAGLAVINSLPGEAENLLNTYQAGLSYPAGDTTALADCMRQYIQDPDTKKAAQRAAFGLATKLLDREKTYPEWGEWLVT